MQHYFLGTPRSPTLSPRHPRRPTGTLVQSIALSEEHRAVVSPQLRVDGHVSPQPPAPRRRTPLSPPPTKKRHLRRPARRLPGALALHHR